MTAVVGRHQLNCGIFFGARSQDGRIGHKGVVFRSDEQGRNTQLREDSLGGRGFVVFVGVVIPKDRGGDDVIELANGADGGNLSVRSAPALSWPCAGSGS